MRQRIPLRVERQAEVSGEGTVSFPCPGVDLSLDDIYEGLLAAPA